MMKGARKMIINLAGTTFLSDVAQRALDSEIIKVGDEIWVQKESDDEPSMESDYAVYCIGINIGWIPKLGTIQRYIAKELDDNNRSKHDMQVKRYKITKAIREQIVLDLARNGCEVKGSICNIQPTDNGYSISINLEN